MSAREKSKTTEFFELPGSSVKGIPLIVDGNQLNIGFVEIGCRETGRRGQLKNKEAMFYEFWEEAYASTGVEWSPDVYRMLAHYELGKYTQADEPDMVDTIVICRYIPEGLLSSLKQSEVEKIFQVIRSEGKRRSVLEHLIATDDAKGLHQLIIEGADEPNYSMIRGKMAEVIILKSIRENIPNGMSMYENSLIRYFTERFENGTEIDGVLTFHKPVSYLQLLDNLNKLEYLDVRNDPAALTQEPYES